MQGTSMFQTKLMLMQFLVLVLIFYQQIGGPTVYSKPPRNDDIFL